MKLMYIIIFFSVTLSAQEPFWVKTNGPDGGLVENIFMNDYSNTLYVGTYLDGIYYSTNYGEGWLKASLNNKTVYCFAALNSNILFAGSEGLYKSVDGGINWLAIDEEFSSNQVRDILILENNMILIATVGKGVYLSTDEGISWQQRNSGIDNNAVYCLAIDYSSTLVAGASSSGLYKSTDFGENWTSINSPSGWIDRAIEFDENNNMYVIAANKIYYSTNFGTKWINISNSVSDKVFSNINLSNNLIFASTWGQGILLTSDLGSNWIEINSGMSGNDSSISNIIKKDSNLFCSSVTGVLNSEISIYGWRRINNDLSINLIKSVFETNQKIYVGTHHLGVFFTTDIGDSWNVIDYDFGSPIISIAANSFNHVFFGSINNGIFRSTNNGFNWENIGLENEAIISIGINSIGYIFAGTETEGIYFSNNNGNNWEIRNKMDY